AVIPTIPKYGANESADIIEAAFLDAINQYWEYNVLRPEPAEDYADDLNQMIKDRIPSVTLGFIVTNMLNYADLSDHYFKRSYSDKQIKTLIKDANLRLIYALSTAPEFDPTAAPDKRIVDMCAFITDHFDLMKNILIEMDQWPAN
ncbi:MAG: hypothetical protein PHC92_11250, partial [Syntrophomonadaceae bacterium]|nr:hypothetical protein [Syntrophomonadaceae bacterium]